MFGLPSWTAPVAGAILALLAAYKCYEIGYKQAASTANSRISDLSLQIEKLNTEALNRQIAANQAAQEQQQQFADALAQKEQELQALKDQNQKDAEKDPKAKECGIGTDSAKRLNKFL